MNPPPGVAGIPVIDVTDLYHPHQDVGDNFDLVAAYALPEIDLRAVILDAHDTFRKPVSYYPLLSKYYVDKDGPRDPGFIPVLQLNETLEFQRPHGRGSVHS